jgi:hypothetical protein
MTRPPQVRAVSRLVVTTALALVLVQVAGVGHLLFGRHGVCPEHGELIELGSDRSDPLAELEDVPRAAPQGSAFLTSVDAIAEHVHCPVFYGRRDATPVSPPVVRALADVAAPLDQAAPLLTPPDSSGRIDVAPKQSPPTA